MSRHVTRVAEILSLAESKKVTDRRSFIKDLHDVYLNDEYIEAINEQTVKDFDACASWNQIMLTIHHVLLTEAEKPPSKATKGNSAMIVQSGCCDLMMKTVNLAVASPAMSLSCADLMAVIFQILGKKIYESYRDTYIGILHHVLTNKSYRTEMSLEQWQEILRLCLSMYRQSPNVIRSVILDTARLAVQYGCLQSHLLPEVRKTLPFLVKVYEEIASGKEMTMKPLYKLTYAVCQQIATESRITLCEFGEKILRSVITLEGCSSKYNMIRLLIQIHHPDGASSIDDGAYACDWDHWRNIIRGIYASIVRDAKAEKLSSCFLKLACEVYRQIMSDPSYITDVGPSCSYSEDAQPRKRRRLSLAVRKPIDMLSDSDLEVTWPSVQILAVLLKKYPNTLKSNDYVAFLRILMELVEASLNNETTMDSLCELCTVIADAEKKHFHETEQAESVRVCWEKICDTILRALSMNQNELLGHRLLQSIIEHRGASNPNSFLRLYLTNAIRWSSSSVKTLLKFCEYTPIPDEINFTGAAAAAATSSKPESSTRNALIRWSLEIPPVKQTSELPVVDLANLLTALVVRSWYERDIRDYRKFYDSTYERKIQSSAELANDLFDDRDEKIFRDIERCSLSLNFRQNFARIIDETMKNNIPTSVRIVRVQDSFDFLMTILNDFIDDRVSVGELESFTIKMTIFGKLMSNFAELNILTEPRATLMTAEFGKFFHKSSSLLVTIDDTKKSGNLVGAIEALENFMAIRYHRDVAKIFIDASSMNYLEFIYHLMSDDENEDENDADDDDIDANTRLFGGSSEGKKIHKRIDGLSNITINESTITRRIVDSSHNILTYYCCASIDDSEMSDGQRRVLRNLLKIELYESSGNRQLRRALNLLNSLGMSEQILLATSQESLKIANNFIRQLYDRRINDETAIRGIIRVLPRFFRPSARIASEMEKLLEILSLIWKNLTKKKYGPLVNEDFVKCLALVSRQDPSLTWRTGRFAEISPIRDVLVDHMTSPFYSVRLEVVDALSVVFAAEELGVPLKIAFFVKIEAAINELFSIEEIANELEKADERETRTCTALRAYATIIRSNEIITCRALFSMIKLSVRRDVKITMLKKALLGVARNEKNQRRIIETNLRYLLSRWFEADYPLQLFPWILDNCSTQEDFSRKHIDALLAIKLQRREFKHFAILCKNLDVSFVETIENSFSTIITLLVCMIVENSSKMNDSVVAATYAQKLYEKLRQNKDEFASMKPFDELLDVKLSEILADLVKRLRDDENFHEIFSRRVYLPSLNPPCFTIVTIDRCFDFFAKILPLGDKSLIEYLARDRPRVLQRVSETLFCAISDASFTDQKLQAFHHYRYFGMIVLGEFQKSYFDPISLYIARDASYSLLALMKQDPLAEMACDYFYEFLRCSMPGRSNEIKECLSFVVSSLVPIVRDSRIRGAMKILNYLIIETKELLADAIARLDSFPNVEAFAAIKRAHGDLKYGGTRNYSLEDEIEHFLNATNAKTLSCSHEGLVNVKNQLSTRKNELSIMYGRLERLRGFAEDCASSTLHKLIYKLVRLTRSSDADVSLEAAKCLGQLGPADLATMILHPENVYAKEGIDQIVMLTFRAVSQLADYLVDNSVNLRRASSTALYEIFATAWGQYLSKETTLSDLIEIHEIDDPLIYRYVYPFIDSTNSRKSRRATISIDLPNWHRCIDAKNDAWIAANYATYESWLVDLTCRLLDCFVNFYTPCLSPVCRESVEFCEILLPRLVNLVQLIDTGLANDVCLCINRFFTNIYESLLRDTVPSTTPTLCENSPKREVSLSHECVRCMINVVNFMRIQTSDNAPMPLNYLYIAKAAQYCSAYFTSVLYAELWCQGVLQDSRLLQDKVPGSWISPIDCICELRPEPGKLLQSIVREAYLHIADPDSIYGCGFSHLVDTSYKIQHYAHLRQWDKAMLAQDVELSAGSGSIRGILNSLRQSGLQALLGRVISTMNRENENIDDFIYEAAWRLADWNIIETHRANDSSDITTSGFSQNFANTAYHSSHYRALRCLREADHAGIKTFLDDARRSLIVSLRKISLECSQTVYPILSQLRMLREIEDFANIVRSENYEEALESWRKENSLTNNHDFQWIEPLLSQRLIMYRAAGNFENLTNISLIETHLDMAKIAEKQGYLPIAARSLDSLGRQNLSRLARDELTYREAYLAWKRNDRDMGRYRMRNLIKKTNLSSNLRAKALRVYGNWMASAKSENPQAVIEKYYQESIRIGCSIASKNFTDLKNLNDAQADLAQFADAQYQRIVEFMRSSQYESLVECTKLKNDDECKSHAGRRGRDEQRAIVTYQRQVTNDAFELENIIREKEMYLILSARYYLMTLQTADRHDLLVFRLVSLWLDNTFSDELNDVLREQLTSVASHKFVILLPQLAPHMSNSLDAFTAKINELMERCAMEHPHHTLPVLFALRNTHRDSDFKQPEKGVDRRNDKLRPESRILAAEALLDRLMDSSIEPIIREMSELSNALVALAYYGVAEAQTRKKDAAHVIPRNHAIMKIRNFTNTCVPTLTLEVRPRGNYNDIIGIREYAANFDLPGGVNAPKKIVCIGTDGVGRKQLVKGQDDLRQDAVMQQVCTVMNRMLRTSKETKKRKLHIRTYKIVPLSQRSGILEWCENTLPISNVLCDTGRVPGMHAKYYPDDWSVTKCRSKLQAVDRSTMDVKLEAFLECCKNLHPAFHHFFMEKYPSAEAWFERRLAYVRSVATTSMVGYMLGLGDRHFSNILIDQTTAEVIHIDFGIAFAQGKVLPIPETVPFRLTRDMEVAMGICGVEGVMRRSCEETVAVLRDRRKILITLLQVLLYDPLFSWAITPVKVDDTENSCTRRYSGRPNEDRGMKKTNKLAERALLRIEQKLQGTEDGISSSIAGQVERLIQQARDPVNLCRLYSGWQAYL